MREGILGTWDSRHRTAPRAAPRMPERACEKACALSCSDLGCDVPHCHSKQWVWGWAHERGLGSLGRLGQLHLTHC